MPSYREDITKDKWMHRPEIQLVKYNIDMEIRQWNVPEKRNNPFFYCYWNKTSGAEIHVGGKVYPLTPEYIMLIPPNLEHSPVQKESFNHSFIHFIALSPFDSMNSIELIPAKEYVHLFRRCESEDRTVLSLYALIFELLLRIPEERFGRRMIRDERIFHACRLISLYCGRNLQLDGLARKLNMSVSNLCHLFKQETGVSPIRYAMERRLERALILLGDSHLSMEEIAEKTGFADRYHFSKAFKSRYATTPVQMRKDLFAPLRPE
ncbi:MAG: helix-turn-helix transcriptional regulator [Victivallales bacterium]|nr:helix-turn-helix transcriptional regulator [Victivallales bacterium]